MRASCAQRRPGPEPRRDQIVYAPTGFGKTRSTKAGARTPARPGVTGAVNVYYRTLNEGRGQNPGETRHLAQNQIVLIERSTKAGARTPARLS